MAGLKMKYFVLKPGGSDIYALASRAALMTYAENIEGTNLQLANDLRDWAKEEFLKAVKTTRREVK